MKKSILTLIVLGLFAASPVLAGDHTHGLDASALGHVHACSQQSETINTKIQRIQSEIEKGDTTYSAKGLQDLEAKLKEINDMLNSDVLKH